jgi:glycosyltransferase involved in cell wall biosynthesis
MNPSRENPAFAEFMDLCEGDSRIVLLTETLSRGETFDLFACCDCFVSLHRAEGFGRGIAESMLLGKPTIVTAYSGNMDFCHPDNSCLVPYKLIPVAQSDYWYSKDQVWADPDTEQAAMFMRRLVDDPSYRQKIAKAGQETIAQNHSPEAAGKRYLDRLGRAYSQIG